MYSNEFLIRWQWLTTSVIQLDLTMWLPGTKLPDLSVPIEGIMLKTIRYTILKKLLKTLFLVLSAGLLDLTMQSGIQSQALPTAKNIRQSPVGNGHCLTSCLPHATRYGEAWRLVRSNSQGGLRKIFNAKITKGLVKIMTSFRRGVVVGMVKLSNDRTCLGNKINPLL